MFDFDNIMNGYFDETSGLISFRDYLLAFAPEAPFEGMVAVLNDKGEVVGQHSFFPDYVLHEGVFARVRAVGPADVTLTEPGLYTLVFVVAGQPVTRFPVKLEQTSAGDDPFDPQKTYRFDGYWRTMAYFTTTEFKGQPVPELTFWIGGKDLVEGERTGSFKLELYRDGQLVAHDRRTTGHIPSGHFRRTTVSLFHPHTEKESPNARLFTQADLLVDGACEVRVSREPDGAKLRSFDFDVSGGKIVPMAKAQLGYTPATDLVLPRVQKKNVTTLQMIEATWISDLR